MTELHKEFLNDFLKLLEKYNALYDSYDVACIHFCEEYDNDNVRTRAYSQIELPSCIDPTVK